MKANRGARGVAIIIGALAGLGLVDNALAAKDSFTIKCKEKGDASGAEVPEYVCRMNNGWVGRGDLPGKPKDPDGRPFPTDKDFVVSIDTMVLTGESSNTKDGEYKPLACPGWWFINGKWVYDAVPPCPGAPF